MNDPYPLLDYQLPPELVPERYEPTSEPVAAFLRDLAAMIAHSAPGAPADLLERTQALLSDMEPDKAEQ